MSKKGQVISDSYVNMIQLTNNYIILHSAINQHDPDCRMQ
jgi:hypothetical protein